MIRRTKARFAEAGVLLMGMMAGGLLMVGCDAVTTSPEPGLLRVTLQANPADSAKEIAGQTYNLNEISAQMNVTISQGRAYRGTTFAQLFRDARDLSEQRQAEFDLLERRSGEIPQHLVYETLLPPATYDSLQGVFTANRFRVPGFGSEVTTAPDASPLVTFRESFQIESEETTTVHLQMSPLASLDRFKDEFRYTPILDVASVEQGESAGDVQPGTTE
jgi:hypothetical protein